jgi:SAM-dependent methyltransferase
MNKNAGPSILGPKSSHHRAPTVASSPEPPASVLRRDVYASVRKVSGYFSRWDFLCERCKNRTILHLGCVGETDVSAEAKAEAFAANRVLHAHLMEVAARVVGVDIDAAAVELIRSRQGVDNLIIGDVEHLEALNLDKIFDIILCGDLLEHLSCPGRALEGIRRLMSPTTQLIVSVPNAFALLGNVRFTLGRYREGAQHVATYSKFQLVTLLERHGFKTTELYTCFDRLPRSWPERMQFAVGVPFFKLLPERGGTLLAIAKVGTGEVVSN